MISNFRRFVVPSKALVRHQSTLKPYLPKLQGINGNTTLGEVYERLYSKYQYRLIYPIAAWAGFLYYTLWTPYATEAEKKAQLARMEKLREYAGEE